MEDEWVTEGETGQKSDVECGAGQRLEAVSAEVPKLAHEGWADSFTPECSEPDPLPSYPQDPSCQ